MTLEQSASLTPEQLRVAVAERLGWKMHDHPDCLAKKDGWTSRNWETWIMHPDGRLVFRSDIHDYPNDLNACHQFEATLNEQQQADYVDWFFHNLPELENQGPNPDEEGDIMCVGLWQLVNATTTQRCRAFLAVTSEVTENRNE